MSAMSSKVEGASSNVVGEIDGNGTVRAGWFKFEDVRYRFDVTEERGRRRIVKGNIAADDGLVSTLVEFGEATIDLDGGLGTFRFVIVDVASREVRITGAVTRTEEEGGLR